MSIREHLLAIQTELSVPKSQRNDFGKYNYRSCEDVLEALKPLLKKHECSLVISDTIEHIGDRFYVKATVTFSDKETGNDSDGTPISVSAYAREADSKKGMDESQITGAASSYARKYALNGLFCIDDTKDADSMDNSKAAGSSTKPASPKKENPLVDGASADRVRKIASLAKDLGMDVVKDIYKPMKISSSPSQKQADGIITRLEQKLVEQTESDNPTDSK